MTNESLQLSCKHFGKLLSSSATHSSATRSYSTNTLKLTSGLPPSPTRSGPKGTLGPVFQYLFFPPIM